MILWNLLPGKWNGEGKHKIIHIDQRPAHINMLYQPEVEVVGDISYSLQQILYRSDAKEEPEEFSNCGKKWWRNMKAMQMPPLFP